MILHWDYPSEPNDQRVSLFSCWIPWSLLWHPAALFQTRSSWMRSPPGCTAVQAVDRGFLFLIQSQAVVVTLILADVSFLFLMKRFSSEYLFLHQLRFLLFWCGWRAAPWSVEHLYPRPLSLNSLLIHLFDTGLDLCFFHSINEYRIWRISLMRARPRGGGWSICYGWSWRGGQSEDQPPKTTGIR